VTGEILVVDGGIPLEVEGELKGFHAVIAR
jgi:hypothetical protein